MIKFKKNIKYILIFLLFGFPILLTRGDTDIWSNGFATYNGNCSYKGHQLYGKIQYVESFPDLKVQVVSSFPDLKVQVVTAFPDECGKWQIVNVFPDLKVQIVNDFPDIRIQYVDAFPGIVH